MEKVSGIILGQVLRKDKWYLGGEQQHLQIIPFPTDLNAAGFFSDTCICQNELFQSFLKDLLCSSKDLKLLIVGTEI